MAVIFLLLIVLVVYIFWDNNRITVAEQEILIDELPEQLEGFTILQISDLHEKVFGENQEELIDAINSVDYDAIVFTGDMLDGVDSENYIPFYKILEGITNKENAWYVPGNADPASYQLHPIFEKSEFVKGIEKRGVELLESMDTVTIEGANVHFVDFELSIIKNPRNIGEINGVVMPIHGGNNHYLAHQKQLWEELTVLDELKASDVLIALNHYPVVDKRVDYIQSDAVTELRDFDLLIAGHYHGGQIRLPFLGALFVPEAWYENGGFFPPQDRVKGLWEYKNIKQYVSTGLGSSDAISFLKFRLFNPPQINVLTLKKGN
ncbi:metallophosphoesterase [Virgibacillus necropolis]|uniref:metallophosphoesterase n=1 Tax=Virgibacillus necropolis TaxID=163877 RepID=UPI00384BF93A